MENQKQILKHIGCPFLWLNQSYNSRSSGQLDLGVLVLFYIVYSTRFKKWISNQFWVQFVGG